MDFNHKMLFITSDTHFNHKNIINFERTQFKTIEDHDNFLIDTHLKWFKSIERAKANVHVLQCFYMAIMISMKI